MKKLFLAVMALAGMITGLTLTSCGGGGGGNNLTGTYIAVNGPASSYYVLFVEREMGEVYSAIISDTAGSADSYMTVSISEARYGGGKDGDTLTYLKGTTSPASLQAKSNAAFYNILTGIISTNNAITQLYFPDGMSFEFDAQKETLLWTGKVSYKAIADNVTQEVDQEIERKDTVLYISKR